MKNNAGKPAQRIRTGSGSDRVRCCWRLRERKPPNHDCLRRGYPVATAPGSDIGSDEAPFCAKSQRPTSHLQRHDLHPVSTVARLNGEKNSCTAKLITPPIPDPCMGRPTKSCA